MHRAYVTRTWTGDCQNCRMKHYPTWTNSALHIAAGDAVEGIFVITGHQGAHAVGHAHNRPAPLG
ncbi:hypothetical protein [Dictyobacter formicarum]|uniref:hypothetical protein n=1 Tax=Dictyobacter formicarum TaxID=2778368 RepID=UPI001915361C|nr:hypothetical protein [Dictyobacter formicarum]